MIEAILVDKRKEKIDGRDRWVVTAQCPTCEESRTVAFAGWSALICPQCLREMHRPKPRRGRPPSGGTRPSRSVRIGDVEWEKAKSRAAARGVTVSKYLRDLVRADQ